MYAEGFKDGRALFDVASRVTATKPIVMYKAGRNVEGARMARSHSGSLAGDYAVSQGALAQAGVTLVSRAEYLLPVAEALATLPTMRSRNVAVISEGGGPITIASESLSERGLELAELSPATQQKIHEIIPNSTVIANPVDIAVLANPSVRNYGLCARAILEDARIDALLFVGWFGAYGRRGGSALAAEEVAVAASLCRLMRELGKPVVVQSHYAQLGTEALDTLRTGGVPVHQDFDIAIECLRAAADRGEASRRLARRVADAPVPVDESCAALIERCRQQVRGMLLEHEARDLLTAYGIPVPPHWLIRHIDEVPGALRTLGDVPLALKIVSADIVHKTDADCVRLHVQGEAAVAAAVREILTNARRHDEGARIDGVLAAPMAARGVEVIVGTSNDPQFGPIMMFGLGGIFVEVMRDVVFRTLPISRDDALSMLAEIRGRRVLDGVRGMPAADIKALVELMLAVSHLALACPGIAEIDLNPVIVHQNGLSIVDARMILVG